MLDATHDVMKHFFKKLFNIKSPDKDVLLKFELDDGKMYEEKIKLHNFEERITVLQKHFHQPKALKDIPFIYCLVGNIVEEQFDNNLGKVVLGTKHFSPRTKVYCYPPTSGEGYEKIKVIGRHRKYQRMITIVIPAGRVTNWRLKTVYNPFVIKEMTANSGWTDKETDKEQINEMLEWLTKR